MSRCEECKQKKIGVFRRPNGRMLCGRCNVLRLRAMSPTGLTRKEEMVTRDLFQYFRNCGLDSDDALEKLAFALASEPAMFTRMVSILDELREE